MALQQHLSYSGRTSEISINLEGRMTVPEVVIRSILQQVSIQGIRPVTILKPGPLIQFPAHTPARSSITAMFQYDTCRLRQLWSRYRRNRMSRMQSEKMIDMPVLIERIVDIFRPFHQLSISSDLVRRHSLKNFLPTGTFLLINVQCPACFNGIKQNFTDYGM